MSSKTFGKLFREWLGNPPGNRPHWSAAVEWYRHVAAQDLWNARDDGAEADDIARQEEALEGCRVLIEIPRELEIEAERRKFLSDRADQYLSSRIAKPRRRLLEALDEFLAACLRSIGPESGLQDELALEVARYMDDRVSAKSGESTRKGRILLRELETLPTPPGYPPVPSDTQLREDVAGLLEASTRRAGSQRTGRPPTGADTRQSRKA